VILGNFWSRFDLRQRRNRKFFGDDQGCLSEQTVRILNSKGSSITRCGSTCWPTVLRYRSKIRRAEFKLYTKKIGKSRS
jgi:hypothetical protein